MSVIGPSFTSHQFSKDSKEAIVYNNGEYQLIHVNDQTVTNLGTRLEQARQKLEELGRREQFPDF